MSISASGPKISDLLRSATELLRHSRVDNPRFEAQLLLAELLGVDRGRLLARGSETLTEDSRSVYESRVQRRAGREPFQYIVGHAEFHDLRFLVDARALIPRPETELLVDAALAMALPAAGRVVDLGTGSGCIAITLAVHRPGWSVTGVERSLAALDLARSNAVRHGVEGRIDFVAADFVALPAAWHDTVDLVVSNPPYVSSEEWKNLEPEVRDHEPREALVPGTSGLEAYELLADVGSALLRAGGQLLVEVGFGQADRVARLLAASGFGEIVKTDDFQGIPRVVQATLGRGERR